MLSHDQATGIQPVALHRRPATPAIDNITAFGSVYEYPVQWDAAEQILGVSPGGRVAKLTPRSRASRRSG